MQISHSVPGSSPALPFPELKWKDHMRLIAAFRPFFKNHISSAMLTFDRGHIISRLQLTAAVHADSHSTARCKFFAVLAVAIRTVHRTLSGE